MVVVVRCECGGLGSVLAWGRCAVLSPGPTYILHAPSCTCNLEIMYDGDEVTSSEIERW